MPYTLRVSLAVSVAALSLSSCAVGPNFEIPQAPEGATTYTQEPMPDETAAADIPGGAAQRFIAGADLQGDWWTLFKSEQLNRMIARALKANPSLIAAQATLRQAHYLLLAQAGTFLPTVDAQATAQRAKQSSIFGTTTTNSVGLAAGFSYVLDIFGGNRRQFESVGAQEDYERFQLEGTYLNLVANVVLAAIDEASLKAQILVTNDIIKSQSQELDLLNQQYQLGAVAKGDVLAQQTQLAQTEATLPPLEKQLSQVRNAMAVILGTIPNQNPEEEVTFETLALPTDLPIGVPAKLIDRRPDVRASEALLHQASAQVGVATAALFPTFEITGNWSASGASPQDLFKQFPSNGTWGLLGTITQPIFHGGQLWYHRRASQAAYDAAEGQYRNTVLTAYSDVANALRAVQIDAQLLNIQLEAERSARQNFEITRERFRAGAISYLEMLDAERLDQQARVLLVQAQANRFADTVLLFQALGGGWWHRDDRGPMTEAEGQEVRAQSEMPMPVTQAPPESNEAPPPIEQVSSGPPGTTSSGTAVPGTATTTPGPTTPTPAATTPPATARTPSSPTPITPTPGH